MHFDFLPPLSTPNGTNEYESHGEPLILREKAQCTTLSTFKPADSMTMRFRLRYVIHRIGFGWFWFLHAVLETQENWVKLPVHCCHKPGRPLAGYLFTEEHVPSDFAASGTKVLSVAGEVTSVLPISSCILPMCTEVFRKPSALRKHLYSKVKHSQRFNSRCAIAPKHRRWVGLTMV